MLLHRVCRTPPGPAHLAALTLSLSQGRVMLDGASGEGGGKGEEWLSGEVVEPAGEVEGGDLGADARPESPAGAGAGKREAEGAGQGAEGGLDALAEAGEGAHDGPPGDVGGAQDGRAPGAGPVGAPAAAAQAP